MLIAFLKVAIDGHLTVMLGFIIAVMNNGPGHSTENGLDNI